LRRKRMQTSESESLLGTTLLALCFLVLFTAFSGSQNLQSSLYADMGSNCLAFIYIAFAGASIFVAQPVVESVGPRVGLVFGAFLYTVFQIANLYPREYTLYPTAAIMGVGASVLWTSQGVYQTRCATPETAGRHSGIFWGIFQWSQITGNIISSLLLHTASATVLFTVFSICGGVSTVLFFFLPNRNVSSQEMEKEKLTPVELAKKMVIMVRTNRQLQLLFPAFIWSGASTGVFYAWFTANWIKHYLGEADVGYIMCVFGAFDILGSVTLGWLSDRVGRTACLLASTMAICAGFADIGFRHGAASVPPWEICLVAALFGLGDAGYNTMISSYLSGPLGEHSTLVFAVWRTLQAGTSAIVLFTISKMHILVVLYGGTAVLLLGFLSFFKCDVALEKEKKKKGPYKFTILNLNGLTFFQNYISSLFLDRDKMATI